MGKPAMAMLMAMMMALAAVATASLTNDHFRDASSMLETAAELQNELRTLEGSTDPAMMGTRCVCTAQVTKSTASAEPSVLVVAQCQRHEAFAEPNSAYRCVCHGTSVPCNVAVEHRVNVTNMATVCDGARNATFPEAVPCTHHLTGLELCGGAAGLHEFQEHAVTTTVTQRGTVTVEQTTCITEHVRNPCAAEGPCETDPVDCVTATGTFGPCSAPCNGGVQTAELTVVTPAKNGGRACPNPLVTQRRCNEQACPQDCRVGEWREFSACTKPCGGGTRTRTRPIVSSPSGGGAECPALTETVPCNTQACAATDCQYSAYSECSACSVSCGGGTCTRTRTVVANATGGGQACDESTLQVTEACGTGACPVDCVVGAWSEWDACSASCGNGTQSRTRPVLTPPAHGGAACPAELAEQRPCNVHECPIDCQVSGWGEWGPCRGDCGTGMRYRQRNVTRAPASGGAPCPVLEESGECDTGEPCVDPECTLSPWSNWSDCGASCGPGFRTRTRTILAQPRPDSNCGTLQEYQPCQIAPCGVDCEWTAWTRWSECSASCGGGVQSRLRGYRTHQVPPGRPCEGNATETQECNTQACSGGGNTGGGSKGDGNSTCDCPCHKVVEPCHCSSTCQEATSVKSSTAVVIDDSSSSSSSLQAVRVTTLGDGSCKDGSYSCAAQITNSLPSNSEPTHLTAHERLSVSPEYVN